MAQEAAPEPDRMGKLPRAAPLGQKSMEVCFFFHPDISDSQLLGLSSHLTAARTKIPHPAMPRPGGARSFKDHTQLINSSVRINHHC